MTNEIRTYVNDRFEKVRAPRTNAVKALKKEIIKRLVLSSRYFVKHGMSEVDAMNAAAKSLTNIKAPIRAALSAEQKKENAHNRVKALVIFLAMVCLVMSPFPVVEDMRFGFVFALGLIAIGVVLLVYSSKSTPKPVDVVAICNAFEIGMVQNNRRKEQEKLKEPPKAPERSRRRAVEEEEEGFEDEQPKGSVYATTSKMLLMVCVAVYVLVSLITLKWVVCLMIFPICFSLTRLAKAFTDFFRADSSNEPAAGGNRKGAGR